jgi:hypothetical protein
MKLLLLLLSLVGCSYQELSGAENRDRIIIIDSGASKEQSRKPYMCKNGTLTAFDNDNGIDEHGHGTNIISLISPSVNEKTTCIISIKIFKTSKLNKSYPNGSQYISALAAAAKFKPKFVNISMVGSPFLEEMKYFMQILLNGGIVTVAAGNEHKDLDKNCFAYPACLKNKLPKYLSSRFNVVTSFTSNGNYGGPVNVYLDGSKKGTPSMTGSSQATAIYTSVLVSK